MKTITIDLKLLQASAAFASTEATHYYLNGVLLHVVEDVGVYYVATDCHRMIVSYRGADDAKPTFSAQIIVPIENCKFKIGKRDAEDATLILNENGSCTVERLDGTASIFKPIDGTFPDWRRVLPDPNAKAGLAHFNFDHAASFRKFSQTMGFGETFIVQRPGEPMPVVFGDGKTQSFGVLMPMRGGPAMAWQLPVWINPAAKAESKAA